jgi:pimeloyl-ACP methyl ester carboxylesterase
MPATIDSDTVAPDALPPDLARLEIIEGCGHFPWLDAPGRYWSVIDDVVAAATPR